MAILALATAVPPYSVKQNEIAEALICKLKLSETDAFKLRKIFSHSKVENRHTAIEHLRNGCFEGALYGESFPKSLPGSKRRNEVFKSVAPALAHQAAKQALENWGGSLKEITHVISVSCTGFMAPGIEFLLVDSLGLPRNTSRLGINFMGCFGAFQGLNTAKAFVKENPKHRVLVVCTELCSLHFQGKASTENIVANCLFADGAAAVVMGGDLKENEEPLWFIEKNTSFALEGSTQEMSWEPGDDGYEMRLTDRVPVKIREGIQSFTEELLGADRDVLAVDWHIHPGGKAILKGIAETIGLNDLHLKPSWEVLRKYGNMSSATFLFVLQEALQQGQLKEKGIGVAFGPGLSMEGVLLSRA